MYLGLPTLTIVAYIVHFVNTFYAFLSILQVNFQQLYQISESGTIRYERHMLFFFLLISS